MVIIKISQRVRLCIVVGVIASTWIMLYFMAVNSVWGSKFDYDAPKTFNMTVEKGEFVYCWESKDENKTRTATCDMICCVNNADVAKIDQYLEGYMQK